MRVLSLNRFARRLVLVIAAVLLALAVAGCGGDDGGEAEAPVTDAAEAAPSAAEPPETEPATPDPVAEDGAPPSESELVGIWIDDSESLTRWSPDGTYALDDHRGALDAGAAEIGTYELEGGRITYTTEHCGAGTHVTEAAMVAAGTLSEVYIEDTCTGASVRPKPSTWTKVSSPTGSFYSPQATEPPAGGGSPPDEVKLAGIWLNLDGEGQLVQFMPGNLADDEPGTYAIDDTGLLVTDPGETGTYLLEEETLTLVAGGSKICEEGNRLVWRAELTDVTTAELAAGLRPRLDLAVIEDQCDRAGEGEQSAWARLAP